jgi:hypothetical protein
MTMATTRASVIVNGSMLDRGYRSKTTKLKTGNTAVRDYQERSQEGKEI